MFNENQKTILQALLNGRWSMFHLTTVSGLSEDDVNSELEALAQWVEYAESDIPEVADAWFIKDRRAVERLL